MILNKKVYEETNLKIVSFFSWGNSWQFLAIPGNSWQFLAISGNSWHFRAIPVNSWQFLAITGDT
jgi:hypothetical protein